MSFKGLKSTTKAKAVCGHLPQVTHLSDLEYKDILLGTDKLLGAMQGAADPPKHDILGAVGKAHFEQRFIERYGQLLRFNYNKAQGYHGAGRPGLPMVFEFAIAELDYDVPGAGDVYYGVNYSPTYEDPLSSTRLTGPPITTVGIDDYLQAAYAHPRTDADDDPAPIFTVVAAHVIAPGLEFRERAKTRLAL